MHSIMTTSVSSVSALTMCAACGKEEDEDTKLKFCNACKLVKYCSRDCQANHRPQHKKACKKRAAEIYDEKLFKEVERDECPICLLPLPGGTLTELFQSCCGKVICHGCMHSMKESEGGLDLCAFCRTPAPTSEKEHKKRLNKLKESGGAFLNFASYYARGSMGMPQDYQKSNELLLKAGELGCAAAYLNLGNSYYFGHGAEVDKKKAKHYYELAAMGGNVEARHCLGILEGKAGNYHRAFKHTTIAARTGHTEALDLVKKGYMHGDVTKDEYANTLRAYHDQQKEMKSDARDKAAEVYRERLRESSTLTFDRSEMQA